MKYPSYAKNNGIEGQVLVVFIVEKTVQFQMQKLVGE